jgi:Subtilisin-like serine proteases
MDNFLPILGNGENYITPDSPRSGPPIKKNLPTFEEVRENFLTDIKEIKNNIKAVDKSLRASEVILNMKMAPGYTAKSFHPNTLIRHAGAIDVGSKKWTGQSDTAKKEIVGKQIFLRMSEESLNYFQNQLHQKESQLPKGFKEEARLIQSFYFNDNSELIKKFGENWSSGRIEVVLHPFGDLEDEVFVKVKDLYSSLGGVSEKIKIRSYSPGPTFLSMLVDRENLEKILFFNPIRTAHPLKLKGLPDFSRSLSGMKLPNLSKDVKPSSIIVGMFDGGVDDKNLYFQNYVKNHDAVQSFEDTEFMKHGNAVAGGLLYGNLQKYRSSQTLPDPVVSVESFRIFPLSDPTDQDLFEVIDAIEEYVPKRDDIKVFNLSIGPEGAIDDDSISRFTYVIDKLASKGDRLFVVAVGNDGDHPDELERRIQAPSDSVNNLSVGAYTFDASNSVIRAPYSSIGIGREGCKVKPDIVEFGGCEQYPFHLVGWDGQHRIFDAGTSFAAPVVASKAAEIIGRCSAASPLVARALLINSSNHPEDKYDRYLGYGVLPDSTDDILGCTNNKVTVLYKQQMLPKQFSKLQIPVVNGLKYKGRVRIRWTIAIATMPNGVHTEDYTTNCIEDIFYPNANKYLFTSPSGKTTRKDIKKDKSEVEELIRQGWTTGKFPITKSGTQYLNEQSRRANFKWDSVVKRDVDIKYSDIDSPYLVLHAMDRNVQNNNDFFYFAIAVTIHYEDYKDDAYEATLKEFNKLQKLQVKARNELLIR